MTAAEESARDDAAVKEFWAAHDKQMKDLALKYIGQQELDRGNLKLEHSQEWFRREWVLNRIKDLMFQAGRCNQRLVRCKSADSPVWKKYEKAERDMMLLADHMALEIMTGSKKV